MVLTELLCDKIMIINTAKTKNAINCSDILKYIVITVGFKIKFRPNF